MEFSLRRFINLDIRISSRDILGVIFPGAIVAYAVIKLGNIPLLNRLENSIDGDWERGLAFAIASFFLGYLLQIPAKGLNPLYNRTYLAWKLRVENKENATEYNSRYRWNYDSIKSHSPEKLGPIELLQGTSDFFRSLTVILIVVCATLFWNSHFYLAAATLVVSLACYWLFCDKLWAAAEASSNTWIQISPPPVAEG